MDELLQRVAEIKGMPASLVKRSAEARAEKTGTTVEAVLQEWVGEEADSAAAESAPSAISSQPSAEEPEADEAPAEITTDYLIQLAADAKRMPPKLILSSATARAEHGNTSLEAVLAEWAGVDLEELRSQAPGVRSQAEKPAEEPKAEEPKAAPVAAAAVALSMDELLAKVAEVKGMPASLAKRSAEARSKKTGEPVEAVLAEWAGIDVEELRTESKEQRPEAAPVTAAAVALSMDELLEKVAEVKGMPASLAKRSAEARSKKTGEPVEAVLAEWAGIDVEGMRAESREQRPATPQPEEPKAQEPEAEEPEAVIEVIEGSAPEVEEPAEEEDAPIARGGYPKWLAAAFVLIPLMAVVYILVTPNGPDCGTAGQLLIDPVTGESVSCDGSEYGLATVDYFAQGESLYGQCVACHSSDGSGGAGPAFAGGAVLATFPAGSCDQHIEWIRIGTARWPDPTYGANEKPVGGFGLMPSFMSMTDEQRASVSLYERVQFGGQPLVEAELDCGLAEADTEGGESTEAAGS